MQIVTMTMKFFSVTCLCDMRINNKKPFKLKLKLLKTPPFQANTCCVFWSALGCCSSYTLISYHNSLLLLLRRQPAEPVLTAALALICRSVLKLFIAVSSYITWFNGKQQQCFLCMNAKKLDKFIIFVKRLS